VKRAWERITASKKRERVTLPSRFTYSSQVMQSRSTCGLMEQSPLESTSGSIGMTRSGKYTELPRLA
jgi:hypothetical protein